MVLKPESPMHRTLMLLVPLMIACDIEEAEFVEDFAAQKCANIDACGKISEKHDTLDECLQFYEIVADEQMVGDNCTFNSGHAKDCLSELDDVEGECPVTDAQSPTCAKVGMYCSGSGSDTGQ